MTGVIQDRITVTGLVATAVRLIDAEENNAAAVFRLASSQRHYSTSARAWIDGGDTNWYTVVAEGKLAVNIAESLEKGQRVLVTGALRVRDKSTMTVEIEADAIGHDLNWGVSKFTRNGFIQPTTEGEAS